MYTSAFNASILWDPSSIGNFVISSYGKTVRVLWFDMSYVLFANTHFQARWFRESCCFSCKLYFTKYFHIFVTYNENMQDHCIILSLISSKFLVRKFCGNDLFDKTFTTENWLKFQYFTQQEPVRKVDGPKKL